MICPNKKLALRKKSFSLVLVFLIPFSSVLYAFDGSSDRNAGHTDAASKNQIGVEIYDEKLAIIARRIREKKKEIADLEKRIKGARAFRNHTRSDRDIIAAANIKKWNLKIEELNNDIVDKYEEEDMADLNMAVLNPEIKDKPDHGLLDLQTETEKQKNEFILAKNENKKNRDDNKNKGEKGKPPSVDDPIIDDPERDQRKKWKEARKKKYKAKFPTEGPNCRVGDRNRGQFAGSCRGKGHGGGGGGDGGGGGGGELFTGLLLGGLIGGLAGMAIGKGSGDKGGSDKEYTAQLRQSRQDRLDAQERDRKDRQERQDYQLQKQVLDLQQARYIKEQDEYKQNQQLLLAAVISSQKNRAAAPKNSKVSDRVEHIDPSGLGAIASVSRAALLANKPFLTSVCRTKDKAACEKRKRQCALNPEGSQCSSASTRLIRSAKEVRVKTRRTQKSAERFFKASPD